MTGRWPANVILSPEMGEVLDQQSGFSQSKPIGRGSIGKPKKRHSGGFGGMQKEDGGNYTDSGGASRFFLQTGYEQWELEWILENGLRPCGMEEA